MDLLRVFLFAGLVLHKLVWEILKTGNRADTKPASPGLFKRIVKYGKIGVLFFLIAQTLFLELLPIMNEPASLRAIGAAIFALGLAIAITGRAQLGKNWANLEDRQVMRGQQLVQAGIYRYIRHPIYSGDMLLVLGLELALNSWLVLGVLVLIAIVFRQTTKEEALLARAFVNYSEYQKRTKRFIPFVV
jgi:protein-S-isoprenylcysteine O-methyltransferase Ste14